MKPGKLLARHEALLAQIDEWAGAVNQRLAFLEAEAQQTTAYPDGAPPGIVSPHMKANLEALAQWADPELWSQDTPCERILTDVLARIQVALAGGDVRPPA